MIITLEIDDDEINEVSGQLAASLVVAEVRRNPAWFVNAASRITAHGYFGKASVEK